MRGELRMRWAVVAEEVELVGIGEAEVLHKRA